MTKPNTKADYIKFVKIHGVDECWEWAGAKDSDGYGSFGAQGKILSGHRTSYELNIGPIPDGMEVLHSCDNPPCTNPKHLFLGTHMDNMQDSSKKNRSGPHLHPEKMAHGDKNGSRTHPESRAFGNKNGAYTHPDRVLCGEQCALSKLTEAQVKEIRLRYQQDNISQKTLGIQFNVSQVLIGKIIRHEIWRHIP